VDRVLLVRREASVLRDDRIELLWEEAGNKVGGRLLIFSKTSETESCSSPLD